MPPLPPGDLSPATLAGLAALGDASSSRLAVPVTPRGGGVTFPAASVTGERLAKSVGYDRPVTHERMLPAEDAGGDDWQERAAILEHDGGWPRAVAEAIASRLLRLSHRDSTAETMRALDRELINTERRRQSLPVAAASPTVEAALIRKLDWLLP